MSLTLQRPTSPTPVPSASGGDPATAGKRRRGWSPRRRSLAVLLPLLVLGALVHAVGMYDAPQRIDDEGTYVAQAWAILNLGELAHYTYWYDHPPLGWIQLAGYAGLTDAFGRAANSVAAGREFMLVLHIVSMALLWLVARRLQFARWAAGLALVLYAVSPVAVQFHRTVYLDNIATPWILASFALALSPTRRLSAFAGAGLCLAIACLTKETSLLVLPVLVWLMWRQSAGATRKYAMTVAGTLFALVGVFYVVFAAVRGELIPGAANTSLMDGVMFQLGGRDSSGSVLVDGTLSNRTASIWLHLDSVLPVLAGFGAIAGLFVRRLRPFAAGLLLLLAVAFRPGGYLPVPLVIAVLPFAVLLVAGLAETGWNTRPKRLAWWPRATVVAVAVVATLVAAPAWGSQLRGLFIAPLDQPMTAATDWIEENVPRDDTILTDDAVWVDLVEMGFEREDVVWYFKPDTDSDVPAGWERYDWVLSTESVRSDPGAFPTLSGALENSRPYASFGERERRVEVRRVMADAPSADDLAELAGARAEAGRALMTNSAIQVSDEAAALLDDGRVSGTLISLLAVLAAERDLVIEDFPMVAGEDPADQPRRSVLIGAVDGDPVSRADLVTLENFVRGQSDAFSPTVVPTDSGVVLRLSALF